MGCENQKSSGLVPCLVEMVIKLIMTDSLGRSCEASIYARTCWCIQNINDLGKHTQVIVAHSTSVRTHIQCLCVRTRAHIHTHILYDYTDKSDYVLFVQITLPSSAEWSNSYQRHPMLVCLLLRASSIRLACWALVYDGQERCCHEKLCRMICLPTANWYDTSASALSS